MSEESFNHNNLREVTRHIHLVQAATQLLGERLIESGEAEDGLHLIQRGLRHDQSKLSGIEWEHLILVDDNDEKAQEMLSYAHYQHVKTNDHHPEFWGPNGINKMPDICIAEMVCDWYARSQQKGTDLRVWIKETASKKFNFSLNGKTYKQIKFFVEMLLDPLFKPVKPVKPVKKPKPETEEKNSE